jgi:hypothetical protein
MMIPAPTMMPEPTVIVAATMLYISFLFVFLTVVNARVHNDHTIACAVVPAATTTGIWAQSVGCHAVGHGQ